MKIHYLHLFLIPILILACTSCKKGNTVLSPKSLADTSGKKTTLTAITNSTTGKTFTSLQSAVAAASNSDVIQIPAGTYTNDFVNITKSITIQGVGGLAHFVATVNPSNGKAKPVNCDAESL